MEKKQLKKLTLKKETVSTLSSDEMNQVKGGGTTSFNDNCSKNFPCCNTKGFVSLPKSCCGDNTASRCDDGCTESTPAATCFDYPTMYYASCAYPCN